MSTSDSSSSGDRPIVVAVTGASGAVYAARLIDVLLGCDASVHLITSDAARLIVRQELGRDRIVDDHPRLVEHRPDDLTARPASGSFLTRAMIVCPCTIASLAAIASGAGGNLIHRAAAVHLKERRPLILVPRETPLSRIDLENMIRATDAGATILPAVPGFYHRPTTIDDLVDFLVSKICDQLGIDSGLIRRWGEE